MKKFLMALVSMLMSGSLLAQSFNLTVTEASESETIQISFATKQIFSSMCNLEISNLQITQATPSDPLPGSSIGQISFNAQTTPAVRCLRAFGPNRGSLSIERSQITSPSYYKLFINNEYNGTLSVDESGAILMDPSEIPQ